MSSYMLEETKKCANIQSTSTKHLT